MRIAICEDERIFRNQLVGYVEKIIGGLDVIIDEYSSGEELLGNYKEKKPYDVIFLDIEMKQINGIETAKRIRKEEQGEIIIFLTSHTECALEGYEVNALRFLEKPVKEQKLRETLQAIMKMQNENKSLVVHSKEGEHRIPIDKILYMESVRNDIYIYTENDQEYRARMNLKDLYQELDERIFYQCHRSYIINLNHVTSFNSKEVSLKNGKVIPVSRGKGNTIKDRMMDSF